jgi:CRISPR-associated endonuclease Cas1
VHYASGFGVKVSIVGGHLVVEHGTGADRRTTRYNRATGKLRRVVIVASTGYISFEAVKWMNDAGCALVQLDHTGRVLVTSATPGNNQPALRREQATAASRPVGVIVMRRLLDGKLAGQEQVARRLDVDAADRIAAQRVALEACSDMASLRTVEARAAGEYWKAWRGVRIAFSTRDATRVPAHWTTFGGRASPLTGTQRAAASPICAMQNFLYGMGEAESRLMLLAVGLDDGVGLLHVDAPARSSLGLDVLESIRPSIDSYLLDALGSRIFRADEFAETSAGQCRIMPKLARELAATSLTWAAEAAPWAELVARMIAADAGMSSPPTILTGDVRRAARPPSDRTQPYRPPRPAPPSRNCPDCGAQIRQDHKRCPVCHQAANTQRLRHHQAEETARRRQNGEYPSQRPEVRARIAEAQRALWADRFDSGSPGGFTGTPSEFRRLILPRLVGLAPRDLARETGLSRGYCAQVRDGKRVPHVRHWAAFQLIGLNASR